MEKSILRGFGKPPCGLLATAASGMVALGVIAFATLPVHAETLAEALAAAYEYNPRLDAERARQRATDETVAQAMSGFRPQIEASGDVNSINVKTRPLSLGDGTIHPKGYRIDFSQPIFRGFRTINAVREQDATVMSGIQQLRGVEQEVLLDVITFYMDVIRDQSIVRLREDNVNVLSKDLKATQERFAVGEVTKTDVAQAQARRAFSVSQLDLARANLKTSRGNFERAVGHPPSKLSEPRGYDTGLPSSLEEAINISAQEHPLVVGALYTEQASRVAVDRIRGELLPEVTLDASYANRFDTSRFTDETEVTTVTGRLRVPIYEGGEVYSRVRQAKHTHISRIQQIEQTRTEVQAIVVRVWSAMQAARAQIESDRVQVSANQTALAGVREEERVGQRSLLDVLDAELELLTSQVQLVGTQRNLVVTSYQILFAMGRLDVANLGVTSVIYDPTVHRDEVRHQFIGTRITDEPSDVWNTQVEPEPVK